MGNVRVPDINHVIIAGRLTHDPELKYTGGGSPYCRVSIANTRYYKDKAGNRQEDTTFVSAVLWGPSSEWVSEHLAKGRPVLLEGGLTTSEWEDKATGQKRSRVEIRAQRIVPLDWDDAEADRRQAGPSRSASAPAGVAEDDIPL